MARKPRQPLPVPAAGADRAEWLRSWDAILVNSSAGKDSQAALDLVAEQAEAATAEQRAVEVEAWAA